MKIIVLAREEANSNQTAAKMPFKSPHVSFVSFAIEVTPARTTDTMVIETDLHLNSRYPAYNGRALQRLIADKQDYLGADANRVTHIRVSLSGEI